MDSSRKAILGLLRLLPMVIFLGEKRLQRQGLHKQVCLSRNYAPSRCFNKFVRREAVNKPINAIAKCFPSLGNSIPHLL